MYEVCDVCKYIIDYSNSNGYYISNLKLQKILYFVQAYFLATTQKPCFQEKIIAWAFGPVILEAYRIYKIFGGGSIPSALQNNGNDVILDKDKKLIEAVVDKFSPYSASELTELTCKQLPWMDSYIPGKNKEITIETMRTYFSE